MWCGSRCFVTPLPTALFLDHPPVDLGPSHRRVALSRKIKIETPLNISVNRSRMYTNSVINNCSPPTPRAPFPPKETITDVRYNLSTSGCESSRRRKGEPPVANEHAMRLQHATSPPLKGFGRGTPPSRERVRAACRPVHPCLRCVEVAEPLLMPAPRFVSLLHTCLVSSPPTPKHQIS